MIIMHCMVPHLCKEIFDVIRLLIPIVLCLGRCNDLEETDSIIDVMDVDPEVDHGWNFNFMEDG